METKYSNDERTNQLHEKMHQLLDNVERIAPYSSAVHDFLKEEYIYPIGHRKRDIMLPLAKEKWPVKFTEFEKFYSASKTKWPVNSHKFYALDALISKAPGILCFGYALCQGEIFPCAFFVVFGMTFKIEGIDDQLFPEEFVIDPMALAYGKAPDCYIGVSVLDSFVEDWLLSDGKTKHPLEMHVLGVNEKRAEDSESEKELLMLEQKMLENTPERYKKTVVQWLCTNQ